MKITITLEPHEMQEIIEKDLKARGYSLDQKSFRFNISQDYDFQGKLIGTETVTATVDASI